LHLRRSARSRHVSCTNPCTARHGLRSSPRSGTLRATPGSPGRQESAHGPIEVSPCRPEGSGVGLCLPGRGDDPFASLISEGGPGCGAAPREKADGFTDRRRSGASAHNDLRRRRQSPSPIDPHPTYVPRPSARTRSRSTRLI
jgi:hypothetical protein